MNCAAFSIDVILLFVFQKSLFIRLEESSGTRGPSTRVLSGFPDNTSYLLKFKQLIQQRMRLPIQHSRF